MQTIIERITGLSREGFELQYGALARVIGPLRKDHDAVARMLGMPSLKVLEAIRAVPLPPGLAEVIGALK